MKTLVPILITRGILLTAFLLFVSLFSSAQNINFGKSYINVSKGNTGGTVEPGDTLEIRASIVVRSGTYDSCAYYDVIPAGTAYITGTVRVLTNEGKIYKQFTDAVGDDQGYRSGANIRINLGYNAAANPATATRRGRIVNTHRPSFYGSTCIMIASFRVRVTAAYGTNISIGGGSMTYRPSGGSLASFIFPTRIVAVYDNVGICPNAVGANSLGTEFNGTFGSGRPRNRGASANVPVGYNYTTFTSGTPNDYFYGIPNNTSINTGYTTSNNWPKPDNSRRVFGVWDIIGDHTGAANPLLGNPAADTVANANAGYMLVINAAYRIDSAFQQTISNLCPNTYYEISVWMRNICSRCGCDSSGRGAGSGGYIPTAPGDSSGVYPNLSFNVDGVDYYTTGNILYTGQWIKKGFTFRTGPTQNSFTLKIFNNAPGGGGNDWALDDISVATCSPNLAFTPNNNPTICEGNVVDLGAYVRSYFNNYTFYKWQRSLDDGATWADAGSVSTGSPAWNGSAWEYYTAFPSFVATSADSGMKFRIVVASTSANINDPNCSFADETSILTLNVIDCGWALSTDFISFNARQEHGSVKLNWATTSEDAPVNYIVERSIDGRNFTALTSVSGRMDSSETNFYNYQDYEFESGYYRIRITADNQVKFSRIIKLEKTIATLSFENIANPFDQNIKGKIVTPTSVSGYLLLIDYSGRMIRKQTVTLVAGSNDIEIETQQLSPGMYSLQFISDGGVRVSQKLMKM